MPGDLAPLEPITDLDRFRDTRDAWHRLAEHVVAPACYRATGRIGLRATEGGFGTPAFPTADGADEQVRVALTDLVVVRGGDARSAPVTTVEDAARVVGIEPGAPTDVYAPATPLEPDAPLRIDATAAARLAAWYAVANLTLEQLRAEAAPDDTPSIVQLWPEHFDLAADLGREDRGARGTFGASPGDAGHPEPYLYVTHWADVPDDPYWSDAVFAGASLGYRDLAGGADPVAAALAFFRRGRELLAVAATRG